ncbi:TMhelix containing protein [Vibrio phage BUCT006]|nr:TMhelix containing protein [Vibrio phage BUCT006]
MGKKMIFTGFDDKSIYKDGVFTIGREYIAMSDDSEKYPENTSKSDGTDGFFLDDGGDGVWELLSSFDNSSKETKYVRPAVTPEARDILNSIHETVGAETRSDSIVEFMGKHTEMEVELCAVKVQLSTLEEQSKRRIEHLDTKVSLTESSCDFWKSECQAANDEVMEEQSKRKGWIIYSAIVAAYAIGISVYCLIGG